MTDSTRIPVIAAIGEIIDRPASLDVALEPIALMAEALRRADAEAGGQLLGRIDSLFVVNQISWPYAAPVDLLCERLGVDPQRRAYGKVGGETPLAFVQRAAALIAGGQASVLAVCGGESHQSVATAKRTMIDLPWMPPTANPLQSIREQDRAHPAAKRLGIHLPITVYPLFENAQTARWGLTPREAIQQSARMWAGFSAVAARNATAALRCPVDPQTIAAPTGDNRMIAWPYTKLMVANISVNQGAAVIVTSLAVAREAGLDDGRLAFIGFGNAAEDPADILARADLAHSPSRDAVLRGALKATSGRIDAFELYSCFPCVPKAAARMLELDADALLTVTGGLTFFGAPLNNYMTHATGAMVRHLRQSAGIGLLYGQGGFATKHRTLVLASVPQPSALFEQDCQADADRDRPPAPALAETADAATIESFTVVHDRDGSRIGAVVGRTELGARVLGEVPADDDEGLDILESIDRSPVGMSGKVLATDPSRHPRWSFTHV